MDNKRFALVRRFHYSHLRRGGVKGIDIHYVSPVLRTMTFTFMDNTRECLEVGPEEYAELMTACYTLTLTELMALKRIGIV